jgi:hypothetical protein
MVFLVLLFILFHWTCLKHAHFQFTLWVMHSKMPSQLPREMKLWTGHLDLHKFSGICLQNYLVPVTQDLRKELHPVSQDYESQPSLLFSCGMLPHSKRRMKAWKSTLERIWLQILWNYSKKFLKVFSENSGIWAMCLHTFPSGLDSPDIHGTIDRKMKEIVSGSCLVFLVTVNSYYFLCSEFLLFLLIISSSLCLKKWPFLAYMDTWCGMCLNLLPGSEDLIQVWAPYFSGGEQMIYTRPGPLFLLFLFYLPLLYLF